MGDLSNYTAAMATMSSNGSYAATMTATMPDETALETSSKRLISTINGEFEQTITYYNNLAVPHNISEQNKQSIVNALVYLRRRHEEMSVLLNTTLSEYRITKDNCSQQELELLRNNGLL